MYPYHPWDERYLYLHEMVVCNGKNIVNVGKHTIDGSYGVESPRKKSSPPRRIYLKQH